MTASKQLKGVLVCHDVTKEIGLTRALIDHLELKAELKEARKANPLDHRDEPYWQRISAFLETTVIHRNDLKIPCSKPPFPGDDKMYRPYYSNLWYDCKCHKRDSEPGDKYEVRIQHRAGCHRKNYNIGSLSQAIRPRMNVTRWRNRVMRQVRVQIIAMNFDSILRSI